MPRIHPVGSSKQALTTYTWTLPQGWAYAASPPFYEDYFSDHTLWASGIGNIIYITPVNVGSATSATFILQVSTPDDCDIMRTFTKSYTVPVDLSTTIAKPKITIPTSGFSKTDVYSTFETTLPAGDVNSINTYWEYYLDGQRVNLNSDINFIERSNVGFLRLSESYFTSRTNKSVVLTAKYRLANDDGTYCADQRSLFSDPIVIIGKDYKHPAPIIENTLVNDMLYTPNQVTFASRNIGNTLKTWEIFADNKKMTEGTDTYTITARTANDDKITVKFSDKIANAKIPAIKVQCSSSIPKVGIRKSESLIKNISSPNLPKGVLAVKSKCTSGIIIELSDPNEYKQVSLSFRLPLVPNSPSPVLSIPFAQAVKVKNKYVYEGVFPEAFAGKTIEYRVRVQTGNGTETLFDWPTPSTPAYALQSFVPETSVGPAIYISSDNDRYDNWIRTWLDNEGDLGDAFNSTHPLTSPVCDNDIIVLKANYTEQGADQKEIKPKKPAVWTIETNGSPLQRTGRTLFALSLRDEIPSFRTLTSLKVTLTADLNSAKCAANSVASITIPINRSNPAFRTNPITPLPITPVGHQYCKGNHVYLYTVPVAGATSYQWTLPMIGNTFLGPNLKNKLVTGNTFQTSYYVRAFDGTCVSDNFSEYGVDNIKFGPNTTAPPPIVFDSFVPYRDKVGNKMMAVNVTQNNGTYHWYNGKLQEASNDPSTNCTFSPFINNFDFVKSGVSDNSISAPIKTYNGIYDYVARCDFAVISQVANGCFTDPLIVYTVNPQTPQFRKELEESKSGSISAVNVNLYPNPAQDELTIETNFETFEVEISNLQGSVIANLSSSGARTTVDLNHLQEGMYIITIQSGSNVSHHKLEVIR